MGKSLLNNDENKTITELEEELDPNMFLSDEDPKTISES